MEDSIPASEEVPSELGDELYVHETTDKNTRLDKIKCQGVRFNCKHCRNSEARKITQGGTSKSSHFERDCKELLFCLRGQQEALWLCAPQEGLQSGLCDIPHLPWTILAHPTLRRAW